MLRVVASFALAFVISLYTTPLMRRAALQFGILDKPRGPLKQHGEPVPYLGGLAVFLAYLISLSVTFEFGYAVLGILLSGTLMLLLGLIDDLREPVHRVSSLCRLRVSRILTEQP